MQAWTARRGAFSPLPELDHFLLFVRPLHRAGIRYIVTGSVAAILYGEPRLTLDLGLIVFLNDNDIASLARIFPHRLGVSNAVISTSFMCQRVSKRIYT